MLGVHASLPGHVLGIALEASGRPPVPAEGPVLVPDLDVGVVEVRAVLRMRGVCHRKGGGLLVDVVDAVQVQKVSDEAFTVALYDFAGKGPVAGLAGGAVVSVGPVLFEVRRGVGKEQPVQVPAVAEALR